MPWLDPKRGDGDYMSGHTSFESSDGTYYAITGRHLEREAIQRRQQEMAKARRHRQLGSIVVDFWIDHFSFQADTAARVWRQCSDDEKDTWISALGMSVQQIEPRLGRFRRRMAFAIQYWQTDKPVLDRQYDNLPGQMDEQVFMQLVGQRSPSITAYMLNKALERLRRESRRRRPPPQW